MVSSSGSLQPSSSPPVISMWVALWFPSSHCSLFSFAYLSLCFGSCLQVKLKNCLVIFWSSIFFLNYYSETLLVCLWLAFISNEIVETGPNSIVKPFLWFNEHNFFQKWNQATCLSFKTFGQHVMLQRILSLMMISALWKTDIFYVNQSHLVIVVWSF